MSEEFQSNIQQFAANYYNQADILKRDGVVINYKTDIMAKGAGVFDIERDVSDIAGRDY